MLPSKEYIAGKRFLLLTIILACFISCEQSPSHKENFYWMMNESCPDDGVRFWISEVGAHEKTCDPSKWSRALALATIFTVINDVNEHKIHYHMREEDRGFVLREYLSDEKSPTGERPLGRSDTYHFHGCYVDLKTAKKLIQAVKFHQHGAE